MKHLVFPKPWCCFSMLPSGDNRKHSLLALWETDKDTKRRWKVIGGALWWSHSKQTSCWGQPESGGNSWRLSNAAKGNIRLSSEAWGVHPNLLILSNKPKTFQASFLAFNVKIWCPSSEIATISNIWKTQISVLITHRAHLKFVFCVFREFHHHSDYSTDNEVKGQEQEEAPPASSVADVSSVHVHGIFQTVASQFDFVKDYSKITPMDEHN